MNKGFRVLIAVVSATLAVGVQAENPLECVDEDVKNTLLSMHGMGPVGVSLDIPQGFPELNLPKAFELIGSSNLGAASTVAYKVVTDIEKTRDTINLSLNSSNWKVRHNPFVQRGGFQTAESELASRSLNICHEEEGYMMVMLSPAPQSGSYVTLTSPSFNSRTQCGFLEERFDQAHRLPALPSLQLPKDAKTKLPGGMGGLSSSGDTASTKTEFETALSLSELLSFFNAQLAEQDWLQEGRWNSARSTGSAWLSGDEAKNGVLNVINLEGSNFKVIFQMIELSR